MYLYPKYQNWNALVLSDPAGTYRCNDVELMSMQRSEVILTSFQRHLFAGEDSSKTVQRENPPAMFQTSP